MDTHYNIKNQEDYSDNDDEDEENEEAKVRNVNNWWEKIFIILHLSSNPGQFGS